MNRRWIWMCAAGGLLAAEVSHSSAQDYRYSRARSGSFLSRHTRSSRETPSALSARLHLVPRPTIDEEDQPDRPPARVANAEATARARRFIAAGDRRFHTQEFGTAYQRYKKAAEIAPDLAEAWFRQGIVQIALGRYPAARRSIRRGLSLDANWPSSSFRLDDLYTDDQLAKGGHLEHLASAVDAEPERADLMFLLGLELFLDGQRHRSRPFFERAIALGEDDVMVRRFLDVIGDQDEPHAEEL